MVRFCKLLLLVVLCYSLLLAKSLKRWIAKIIKDHLFSFSAFINLYNMISVYSFSPYSNIILIAMIFFASTPVTCSIILWKIALFLFCVAFLSTSVNLLVCCYHFLKWSSMGLWSIFIKTVILTNKCNASSTSERDRWNFMDIIREESLKHLTLTHMTYQSCHIGHEWMKSFIYVNKQS